MDIVVIYPRRTAMITANLLGKEVVVVHFVICVASGIQTASNGATQRLIVQTVGVSMVGVTCVVNATSLGRHLGRSLQKRRR